MHKKLFGLGTAVGALLISTAAFAAPVEFDGNVCGGDPFTAVDDSKPLNFENCAYEGSASITKFNFGGQADPGFYGDLSDRFTLNYTLNDDNEPLTVSWTYAPQVGDPTVTYWTVKFGNGGVILGDGTAITSGEYTVPGRQAISNVGFFNGTHVPTPGALALLGAGLFGLGMMRRKSCA